MICGELSSYFFVSPSAYDEKAVKKQWKEKTPDILGGLLVVLQDLSTFDSATIESSVKSWIEREELSFGMVMAPLRLVIVGGLKGPHLFDILAMIGQEESLKRIKTAIEQLP